MSPPISRGTSFGNRRKHPRMNTEQHLILISVASRIEGVIRDVSRLGARVSLRAAAPRCGRDVLLRWGSQEVFGHVVWSEGTEAGISFHKPIDDDDLAETVGAMLPDPLPSERMVL